MHFKCSRSINSTPEARLLIGFLRERGEDLFGVFPRGGEDFWRSIQVSNALLVISWTELILGYMMH